MRVLVTSVLAVILSACASVGVQVTEEQVKGFEIGKTTYQDVISKLGTPSQRIVSADGSKQAYYIYAASKARPETFIPFVGPFVGGADTRTNAVFFIFDKADTLTDYKTSEGAMGTGMGFAAGNPQGRTPNQPELAD